MQQTFPKSGLRAEIAEAERRHGLKRLFDIVGAGALIILLMPLMLAVGLAIMLLDGAPVFFGHVRIGRNGRPFRCWKFRTMVRDADERLVELLATDPEADAEWRECRKLREDPRIIPGVGALLRKTSLDELPQLFNVLKGEMSLVGPRPVTEEELEYYGAVRFHYLSMRPGMTGPWQVGDRSDGDYVGRVRQDREYVESWSLGGDAAILWRTLAVPFRRDGAY